MNRVQVKMLSLLRETVAFYAADTTRRAVCEDTGGCKYLTSDGRKCAFGRYIKDPSVLDRWQLSSSLEGLMQDDSVDWLLPEELKGLSPKFWRRLQLLHDTTPFWDENGLTLAGHEAALVLENTIRNGVYDD